MSDRDERGRFKPGCRGGPGAGNVRYVTVMRAAIREAVNAGEVREVLRAMLTAAKKGDTAASKLLLEYGLGKPTAIAADPTGVELPKLDSVSACVEAGERLTAAVLRGELAAADAERLARIIDVAQRGLEAMEVGARLDEIEGARVFLKLEAGGLRA